MAYTVKWTNKELIEGLVEAEYLKHKCGLPFRTKWIKDELDRRGVNFNSDFSDKDLFWLLVLARESYNYKAVEKFSKWIKSRGLINLMNEIKSSGNVAEFDEYGNLVPFSG